MKAPPKPRKTFFRGEGYTGKTFLIGMTSKKLAKIDELSEGLRSNTFLRPCGIGFLANEPCPDHGVACEALSKRRCWEGEGGGRMKKEKIKWNN